MQLVLRKLFQHGPYWCPGMKKLVQDLQEQRQQQSPGLVKDGCIRLHTPSLIKAEPLNTPLPVAKRKRAPNSVDISTTSRAVKSVKRTSHPEWYKGDVVNLKIKRGQKFQNTGTHPHDAPAIVRLKQLFDWVVQVRGGRPQDAAETIRELTDDKDVIR